MLKEKLWKTPESEFLISLVSFWLKCRLHSIQCKTKDNWLGTLGQLDYEIEMQLLIIEWKTQK
jgi:hypothetical protein